MTTSFSQAHSESAKRNSQILHARANLQPSPPIHQKQFSFKGLPRPPLVAFGLPQKKEESSHESAGADVVTAKREDGPVVLVPIKLDFDVDTHGFRLKDQFCWNLNETLVSPLLYAQQLVSDFRLPPAAVEEISKAIKDQTEEFYDHTYIRPPIGSQGLEPPLDPLPPIKSLSNRKQLSSETPTMHLDDHPNLRVSLKIDVSIGTITVMDNVEWDLNCSRNSPEDFALVMCCELGLTPEFRVAIAHQLRDQIHMYHKTLFALEHPFDDSQIDDEDLWFNHFLPPVEAAERKPENRAFYTPTILTGAMPSQAPTSLDDKPNSTTARRRRAGATNRARGRTALPEREVTRLWMSALPIWRNGVKRGTMPRGVPAQMQATATTGLLPRRRTRQDTALEVMEEETDALMGGVTLVESLGMKRQEKWKAWACQNCRATITKTELIRRGPEGASTLCDACGLHFSKTGEMRSCASTSEPETIAKNWYQYPKIVDAHRDD
ncbi:SWI/SNF chromatin-remodeling complex subunit [Chytriomyces hyalinus]|nr:SWI/SNF chromatin-remodeling complex subunit [Chytriomyces hyalinus]